MYKTVVDHQSDLNCTSIVLLPQLEVLLEALDGHLHHGATVLLEGLQGSFPRLIPGVHVAVCGCFYLINNNYHFSYSSK